ncbi:hypothetical protein B0E38_02557 [Streptomyces sp. 111WW2]|uniref:hypothetical protein n=1 Tax=Streptomyces sp. 111WW2 TaxID=1945515 RepID=UPI000D0C7A77|nr:hypothetical protein [Streptomyces sp. 111WW2]PSK57026.1 hypothetical protein B0E38_02557 [Streptomyces sp. 111WW2]
MSLFTDLHGTAYLLHHGGLHTGTQFASPEGPLDVCAAAYAITEGDLPDAFYNDECTSLDIIEASDRAMAVIRAISAALDSEPCETNGRPDYIEHVSNWAATPPIGEHFPPRTSEVIGCILRAADTHAEQTTNPHAA